MVGTSNRVRSLAIALCLGSCTNEPRVPLSVSAVGGLAYSNRLMFSEDWQPRRVGTALHVDYTAIFENRGVKPASVALNDAKASVDEAPVQVQCHRWRQPAVGGTIVLLSNQQVRIECDINAVTDLNTSTPRSDRDVELRLPVDGGGGVVADARFSYYLRGEDFE